MRSQRNDPKAGHGLALPAICSPCGLQDVHIFSFAPFWLEGASPFHDQQAGNCERQNQRSVSCNTPFRALARFPEPMHYAVENPGQTPSCYQPERDGMPSKLVHVRQHIAQFSLDRDQAALDIVCCCTLKQLQAAAIRRLGMASSCGDGQRQGGEESVFHGWIFLPFIRKA